MDGEVTMQNLKSLENVIQKPVMGRNDDTLKMVGHRQVDIYSYEEEMEQMLSKIQEPQRKLLKNQLLKGSYQD